MRNASFIYLVILGTIIGWAHSHPVAAIGLGLLAVLLAVTRYRWRQNYLRSLADQFVARPARWRGVLDRRAKARILKAQGYLCNTPGCGADLRRHCHWDHLVPRARGGGDDISNRHALCPPCNLRKGSKDWAVFLAGRRL